MNHGLLSTPIRISHFPTNPDFPVHQPMMRTAQQDQVAHHSRATVRPVPDMMRISPRRYTRAAGERAAFVSGDQRHSLLRGDHPFPGFRIQRRAVIVEQDGGEETITPEKPGLRHRQRPQPRHVPDIEIRRRLFTIGGCGGAVPMLSQITSIDVHIHVWTLTTIGTSLRAVQITPDQFREPIRGPLRRRPRIRRPIRCRGRHRQIRQRRQQHFTGQGIEITTHHHPTIQCRRDPQLIEIDILGGRNLIRLEQPLQRRDHVPHLRRRRLHTRRSRQQ